MQPKVEFRYLVVFWFSASVLRNLHIIWLNYFPFLAFAILENLFYWQKQPLVFFATVDVCYLKNSLWLLFTLWMPSVEWRWLTLPSSKKVVGVCNMICSLCINSVSGYVNLSYSWNLPWSSQLKCKHDLILSAEARVSQVDVAASVSVVLEHSWACFPDISHCRNTFVQL